MSKYAFKKRVSSLSMSSSLNRELYKIVFKTEGDDWVDTKESVVIPFSIHSNFHEGSVGDSKVFTLVSVIREYTQAKITILLTEDAHMHALNIIHNNYQKTSEICLRDAQLLAERFKVIFKDLDIQFWNSFITSDCNYVKYKKFILDIYKTDKQFQQLLYQDAESTYIPIRAESATDRQAFIENTILDLLEQIVYLFIISDQGYRFEFYPGKPYPSSNYINENYLPKEKIITRVPVSISLER